MDYSKEKTRDYHKKAENHTIGLWRVMEPQSINLVFQKVKEVEYLEAKQMTRLIRWIMAIFLVTVVSTLCYITYCYCINSSERTLAYMAEVNKTYCDQMIKCKAEGYDFIVDGVTLVDVSDEFITSSFGKYNTVCDDAGNQVIMTTLQPQLEERSNTTTPIFFWWF